MNRICSVENCDKPKKTRGMCGKHYKRFMKFGDVNMVKPKGGARYYGGSSIERKGRNITYRSAHMRIEYLRGKASNHMCIDCGQTAYHWAYDHSDTNELTAPNGMVYSPDVERYDPRCVPCHKVYDAQKG